MKLLETFKKMDMINKEATLAGSKNFIKHFKIKLKANATRIENRITSEIASRNTKTSSYRIHCKKRRGKETQ